MPVLPPRLMVETFRILTSNREPMKEHRSRDFIEGRKLGLMYFDGVPISFEVPVCQVPVTVKNLQLSTKCRR